jgi:hypothetical protein
MSWHGPVRAPGVECARFGGQVSWSPLRGGARVRAHYASLRPRGMTTCESVTSEGQRLVRPR